MSVVRHIVCIMTADRIATPSAPTSALTFGAINFAATNRLGTEPGRREEQVARMLELGATREWDALDEVHWVEWTTMADPDGNLFCVSCPRA